MIYRKRVIDPELKKIVLDFDTNKLTVHFDCKRGIYCIVGGKEVFYPKTGPHCSIFRTILFLIKKAEPIKIDRLAKHTEQQSKTVARSIDRFNQTFKNTFNTTKNLVISSDSGIYSINLKDFDFS